MVFFVYYLSRLFLLLFIFTIQSCSMLQNNASGLTINNLIIEEPLPINYKHEVAIASLTQAIQRADFNNEQRAEIHYERGTYYDKVGLRTLAFFDFKHALKLKPDMVEAYNFIGIHFTQLSEFDQAYDAFDSVLALDENHEFAYLNRGIALYFGDRPLLAKSDLLAFYHRDPTDPYRILWLYFAEEQLDEESAKYNMRMRLKQLDHNVWGIHIIALYLGDINVQQFMQLISLNAKSKEELIERICESYFYLGKLAEFSGDKELAKKYYKLSLATKVYDFVEHRYAKLALDLMDEESIEPLTTNN